MASSRLSAAWLTGCLLVPAVSVVPWVHEPVRDWISARLPAKAAGDTEKRKAPGDAGKSLAEDLETWLTHKPVPRWVTDRAKLEQRLLALGGRHLVLVDYADDHSYHEEWVYNEADIDGAQIVWARPMGPEGADRLARYFTDRTVWLLKVATK